MFVFYIAILVLVFHAKLLLLLGLVLVARK